MADDTTIIEGTVKFRDGKKWKSRWCVMRRLSPVADSVQLQLYRDARARSRRLARLAGVAGVAGAAGAAAGGARGGVKASLSLQHYLGCEAGFTLDKHSNTLALVCQEFVAVLAFETRERLLQWQVKVSSALGEARQWLVLVASAGRDSVDAGGAVVSAGPARLHLHAARAALTAGLPPRLLVVWELQHLRRFGVVEGRFCVEGGSRCGAGAGLHALVSDAASDIASAFERAVRGRLSPRRLPLRDRRNNVGQIPDSVSHREFRSETRFSGQIGEGSIVGVEYRGEDWAAAERGEDALSLSGAAGSEGGGSSWGAREAALARCVSCMSKLGALSRSSTAALTPGAKHFSPAWTMEALTERTQAPAACACDPPPRPPRPPHLELSLTRKPNTSCACEPCVDRTRTGPYENYDVPKVPSAEVEGEYYDTPKRLKESMRDLFQITKSSTSNAVILKKPCGCLLKFGRRRREPTVVEAAEGPQARACPCRRVTDWANSWIRLPYCRRNDKENVTPNEDSREALYATVDFARKARSRARDDSTLTPDTPADARHFEIDDGPLANYENLNFALSLEYYENARDLLRRVGVTQAELDAIGASLRQPFIRKDQCDRCERCGKQRQPDVGDDYLTMTPSTREDGDAEERSCAPLAGYTPMSPIGGFTFHSLRLPVRSPGGVGPFDEKSASNPTLFAKDMRTPATPDHANGAERIDRRKRSNSADSSRFLEDVEEYEAGGSASSIETLRNAEPAARRTGEACGCGGGAASDADSSERAECAGRRAVGGVAAGNRDSSSSADSGVSSCPRELPATTHRYRAARRSSPARRSRSTDVRSADDDGDARGDLSHKSSSAEAEVPVLPIEPLRGVVDSRSTSSGTSDMSDYIETLSICSSHSSTDTPVTLRMCGGGAQAQTSTLRPRSGGEYRAAPRLRAAPAPRLRAAPAPRRPPRPAHSAHPETSLYSNLP